MTRIASLVVAFGLIAAVALTAADDKETKAKFDPAKLVGAWTISDGLKAGDKMSDDAKKSKVTIAKDKITMKGEDMTFAFSYKIDATKSPVEIDLEILEPEGFKGSKAKGLIKVEDGKTILVYNPTPDAARPTDFKSTKDNGNFLFTLTAEKAAGGTATTTRGTMRSAATYRSTTTAK